MRCLAIAQEWKRRGGEVVFVTHCAFESLAGRIESSIGPPVRLGSHHPSPSDLENTLAIVERQGWVVVLDGYHFDAAYERALRALGALVLTIDDEGERQKVEANLLLNQNIEAPNLDYRLPPGGVALLGTRYALLRREFTEPTRKERIHPETATNVLVTMGGADPDNHTLTVLRALDRVCNLVEGNIAVTVIVGAANSHKAVLEQKIRKTRCNVDLVSDVSDMPRRMADADVVVSAAGTTVWELCYLGVPSLVVVVADNQIGIARGTAAVGAVVNLGVASDLEVDSMASVISEVLTDKGRRIVLSRNAAALVDGKGAVRTVDAMLASASRPS